MFPIQWWHIVIVIIVAFLIFGANRLPEAGRSIGKAISEFRKGTKEAAEGFKEEVKGPSAAPATPTQVQPTVSTQPAGTAGNFCIHCGAPNLAEARFCASCGSKLPEKIA